MKEKVPKSSQIRPKHVAIIMDGNGRWAKARGLARSAGHVAGYENLKALLPFIFKKGVAVVTLYAFSVKNWKRSDEEVNALFEIFRTAVDQCSEFAEQNIRIKFIGDRNNLRIRGFGDLVESMGRVEEETAGNTGGTLVVAINYSGRDEITRAVIKIIKRNVHPAVVGESTIPIYLDTWKFPDPDLIIRTAGEQRLSDFLSWQGADAELYFSRKLWPDFSKRDFFRAIKAYGARERRYGRASP